MDKIKKIESEKEIIKLQCENKFLKEMNDQLKENIKDLRNNKKSVNSLNCDAAMLLIKNKWL